MKRNITLSLDKELLSKLRVIAAQRSTSVSRLLADELTGLVERAEEYERAKRAALHALDVGLCLASIIGWSKHLVGGSGAPPRGARDRGGAPLPRDAAAARCCSSRFHRAFGAVDSIR